MGDTTKSHQVVFLTLTKLVQGCVLAIPKTKDFVFISRTDLKSEDATSAVVHFTSAPSALTKLISGILGIKLAPSF